MDQMEHSGSSMHHDAGMSHHGGDKFSLNFSGIDWKKEVMNALEILKLNKTKMHEVATSSQATTVAFSFIVVPHLVSILLTAILLNRWFGSWQFIVVPYVLNIILPFVSIWVIDFVANKFFQGKGNLIHFFRVVGYTNVISLLGPVVVLLSFVSWGLAGLAGLVALAAGIWMLVVGYHLLKEMYKLTDQNAVLTIVIAIVVMWAVNMVINRIFLPAPEDIARDLLNRYLR